MKFKNLITSLSLDRTLRIAFFYFIKKMFNKYSKIYFSQTGEDILINNILNKKKGFYIDVGCNEPIKNSNTFLLYCQGWRGINIDANNELVKKSKKLKKKDISICAAISDTEKEVTYYKSNQNAVNTIDTSIIEKWKKNWTFSTSEKLYTMTLDHLLESFIPEFVEIDLLSIDVEGHDYQVVKSINLNKYRPKLIVIEMHDFEIIEAQKNEIYNYLISSGYKLVAYAIMNGYFLNIKNQDKNVASSFKS
jgi:FkbM family methyltransferase